MLADLNKVFMMYTTGHWIYSNRGSSTREAEVSPVWYGYQGYQIGAENDAGLSRAL